MRRIADLCDRTVGLGIAALILFTPLAFGSVDTWAIFDMEVAVFAIGCLWLTTRSLRRSPRPSTGLEIPIAVFAAIVLFQLVPLPRAALAVLSPRITALYAQTVPGFEGPAGASFEQWLLDKDAVRTGPLSPSAAAGARGGKGIWMPLSYSPPDTIDHLVLFSAFALLFLIVADRYRDPARARRLTVWIVFVGVGVAIEGIFQKLAWTGKILWWKRPPGNAIPFGPFVNPNHFAGYMELIVPLTLGLLLTLLASHGLLGYRLGKRRARVAAAIPEASPPATRIVHDEPAPGPVLPWTESHATAKAVLLGFLLVLSIASIVLSLSRGGFIATVVTFALFSRLILPPGLRGRIRWGTLAVVLAVLVGVVGLTAWLGGSAIAERAATLAAASKEPSFTSRFDLWLRSLRLVRDHPLFGAGLGGFELAFYRYTPPSANRVWGAAHNDYVQLATEVGLIGAIPVIAALVMFLRGPVRRALGERSRRDRYLVVGLVMALVSMSLHSFVDFSLQIPAVGFLFVVIGGLLSALASPAPGLESGPRRISTSGRLLVSLGAVMLVVGTGVCAATAWKRVSARDIMSEATQQSDNDRKLELFEAARRTTPTRPEAIQSYADEAVWVFDAAYRPDPRKILLGRPVLQRAEAAYRGLTGLLPVSAWGWWGLGEVYARLSVLDRLEAESALEALTPSSEADLGPRPRLALAALRTAGLLEPSTTGILDDLARLYIQEGLREKGLEALRTSLRMWPELVSHDIGSITALPEDVYHAIVRGMDEALKEMHGTEAGGVQQRLGEMAHQRNDYEEAERRFRAGLAASPSRLIADSLRLDLGHLLRTMKRYPEAEAEFRQVTANPVFGWRGWIGLGEVRAERGDHAGALQALRVAATLAPEDDRPALRIAREAALAGEHEVAVGQLRYIIGSQPRALEARALLVEILRNDGKWSEALAEAKALLALEPSRAEYRHLEESVERSLRGGAPSGNGR